MNALSFRSEQRLLGVAPQLVAVVRLAITLSKVDFGVIEGLRSRETMAVNWGKGRTAAECIAANVSKDYAQPQLDKVTWLRDPYNSNHRKMADGFGHAVDLGAYIDGVYEGAKQEPYDAIALAMFEAGHRLKTHLRWGADWDGDGKYHERGETDMGHFEL